MLINYVSGVIDFLQYPKSLVIKIEEVPDYIKSCNGQPGVIYIGSDNFSKYEKLSPVATAEVDDLYILLPYHQNENHSYKFIYQINNWHYNNYIITKEIKIVKYGSGSKDKWLLQGLTEFQIILNKFDPTFNSLEK